MPLITLENKSAGLGQPSPNSFGPVEQFTYTLSSEMLLAPGSRVSLKRARFLVSAETYSVTRDNNKFAVIVNYDSNDAPPSGYDVVDRTTSGIVVKGEVEPGYYNGDSLAQAIEDSLNAKLAGVEVLSGKNIEFSVVFTDSVVSTADKDSFTISMKETQSSVTITDPQLPSSLAVFDDSFERGENIGDLAAKDNNPIALGDGREAWVYTSKTGGSIKLMLNELNPSLTWTDAFSALNGKLLSCATNVYDTLPVPEQIGGGNETSFTASMPVNVAEGSDASDNLYACNYTYGVYLALMTHAKASELTNRFGVRSAYPFAALNMFSHEEGITMASGLQVSVRPNPDLASGSPITLSGSLEGDIRAFVNTGTQSFRLDDLPTFNENTRSSAPIDALQEVYHTEFELKSDMAPGASDKLFPFNVTCERVGSETCFCDIEFEGGTDLVYKGTGLDIGTITGSITGTLISADPGGYVPVVFLQTRYDKSFALGPVQEQAKLGDAVLWANVQQNVYKKSTSDAPTLASGITAGTPDADATSNTQSPVLRTDRAYVEDGGTLYPVEVAIRETYDPAFAGSSIDVSHVADGAEFDVVLTSGQWHTLLVENINVYNKGDANRPYVLPIPITHGPDTVLVDPFKTEHLSRVLAADGGADEAHPAVSSISSEEIVLFKPPGAASNPSNTYDLYHPARQFVPAYNQLGWDYGKVSVRVRLVKKQGANTVRIASPIGTYSVQGPASFIPNPGHTFQITDLDVGTEPVVHHAANLRGAPPLITYKGSLGRHALPEGYEPYHADPSTDLLAFGSNHMHVSDGANTFKGTFVYLNQLWSMLGVYVPGQSKTDASWVQFKSGDSVTSNATPDPFDFKSGICVHLRNIPITSYLSNGQSARILDFIDDTTQKSQVFSRVVDNKDRRMYEVVYEPSDPTEHVINSSQTVRARNLDILLSDFGGRTFDTNTTTATNPIYSVSLTLDFRLPNPLLEKLASGGGSDQPASKRSKHQ